ncbi:MAG: Mu-like prophage major head subunit gpT family protein [Ktedonobacteraceae bacterium]|nr:Mu-like prophage major head subunit gpT family protein [Ktedonobacteraceae bacterium]
MQQSTEQQPGAPAPITLHPRIIEQLDDHFTGHSGPADHAVRVTIIRGGTSANGYHYDEQALRTIAHLVEGAQAYADHSGSGEITRSVRDLVGFYHDATYVPPSPGEPHGRVDATLHILESAGWLWPLVREACQPGHSDLVGLSIDIFGQWQLNEATGARDVTAIAALNSCDIVTRPSAGGTFRRILHGTTASSPSTSNLSCTYEGASSMPDMPDMSDNSALTEHAATPITQPAHIAEQQQLKRMMHELRLEHCALQLERRLSESLLPQPVRDSVRQRFARQIFEEADLERELSSARGMMAQLEQQGLVRGHGYERPYIDSQITESEKIQAAFDAMFDLDIDTARLGNVRGFTSIREAYARVTGDPTLAAGITASSTLGSIRVSEHAPLARISEADTTTATFSYLLGTSMNKRLLKDYQSWPAEWQRFVTITPIRDFKQQTRIRLGAFGSLSIVAEDSAYQSVSLTDSAATYVAQKRGNIVTVSRETIINDDLQAIKQIPTKLAVAAAYTLAEFVYGFLTTNPTIYDGSQLFTAGAPHNNLGSSALSSLALQQGVTAMRKQTNYAGKVLGLRPRFLVVPPELEFSAMVITQSAGLPGSPNNDINPMRGYVTPIVSPQITTATQWFLAGDPREIDTIEIGFVGGQINPALFIQDMPLLGLNFSQDAITYKIRHEYGGAVVDYRGLYRGN